MTCFPAIRLWRLPKKTESSVKSTLAHWYSGIWDCGAALLLFLPFFGIRSNKTAQAVSVEADVHLFRNQCNRFKTRIALALFNLNDGSSAMFPVLMSAPPIYDAQEIEEYRQKSAEMIEIDGRTLSRYEWTQEQRKIETAIRAQKDISNLARAAGLTDEARKASAKIDRLYDRYDQISAAAGLEKQYSRGYVRGYREAKAAKATTGGQPQTQRVSSAPIVDTPKEIKAQPPLQKQAKKRIIESNDAVIFFEKAADKAEKDEAQPVAFNLQLFAEEDLKKQTSRSLKKGIENLTKRYEDHIDKTQHPEKYDPNFNTYTEAHQKGLIHHWEKEKKQFLEAIERRKKELRDRGEPYDD